MRGKEMSRQRKCARSCASSPNRAPPARPLIARLDVRHQGTVRTAEGAGIGDTEERIHALYPGRVEVQPQKYVSGHYLIVTPEAPVDSQYRMIFETDGRRVTSYRTGRLPEVRWVEGCS